MSRNGLSQGYGRTHTHVSVAILAQAEHLLQILCTPMASDMVTCKICKKGTPTVWDGRKRPKLPPFWKWVWCCTPDGWKDCCTCKLCRFEIWRDCTKLEPYLSIEDFYAAPRTGSPRYAQVAPLPFSQRPLHKKSPPQKTMLSLHKNL